jgi:hypothetical protein
MSKNSSQEKNIQQSRDVKERVEELTLQQLTLFFKKKTLQFPNKRMDLTHPRCC